MEQPGITGGIIASALEGGENHQICAVEDVKGLLMDDQMRWELRQEE